MIASVQGKFFYPKAAQPVIDVADWNIQQGGFTLVLGPVGCGKSALLKALLGELSPFNGEIQITYPVVAYCEQSPWLPNGTIREVISGHSELDEAWYQSVLRACALDRDAESWPDCDETLVGNKGVSLSGGQKQRIVSLNTFN